MNITITNSYVLKWQLKDHTNYKWSECGKCFNAKTGKEIKKVLCGRSVGYCIKGKFISLNTLRKNIEIIPKIDCPF